MEHGHQTVEHLRGYGVVDVSILLIVHLVRVTTSVATIEHLLDEELYFLLVAQPVLVGYVLALLFSVEAFSVIGSHLDPRKGSLTRTAHTLVGLFGSFLDHRVDMLDFDVPIERHVTHHDSDILRRDIAIAVKVVHLEGELHFGFQVTHEYEYEVVHKTSLCDKLVVLLIL